MPCVPSSIRSEWQEPRRIKTAVIPTYVLDRMVRTGEQVNDVHKVLVGVPPDATLLWVTTALASLKDNGAGLYIPDGFAVHLIYEHPDWEEIPPDAIIPEIVCTLYTNPEEVYTAEQLAFYREMADMRQSHGPPA